MFLFYLQYAACSKQPPWAPPEPALEKEDGGGSR
ncbi:hypothetical protein EYZ11_006491 [Aspergillus tanneri]|uniref:Uncharacterized protein n=1 Tax=Aspergillus tanneri TaxID=1220188 RepID=A0A4S3JFB6_9EURO|nr:hypothetical protein EYZ11_006491 [Aspergillus tanneri]